MTSSRDLPNPGITPRFPALQADSLLSEPPRKPSFGICRKKYRSYITLQKFWMRSLEFEPCLPDFKTYAFFTTYQSTVLSNDKSCFWRSEKSVIRMKAEDTGLTYFIESFIGNYFHRGKFYFNSDLIVDTFTFWGRWYNSSHRWTRSRQRAQRLVRHKDKNESLPVTLCY